MLWHCDNHMGLGCHWRLLPWVSQQASRHPMIHVDPGCGYVIDLIVHRAQLTSASLKSTT